MTQITKLQNLINSYEQNIDHYRSDKYNETQLRTDFLDPLFSILGWDIRNNAGRTTNEREVLVEEGLKSGAGENTKKPDYTFRLFSERKFFVEAKKPSVRIDLNPEPAQQVRRYGFTAKLKISVLSNFEYTAIYDCSNQVQSNDAASNSRIKLYHYTELLQKLEEINRLIGQESVYSGLFDNEWESIENKIKRFSIDDLFLQQINEWRLHLAKEFIRIKPCLNEIELNDLIQNYINSIVFLRVCEDRNLERFETLYQLAVQKDFKALIKNLKKSDKKYNSGLFNLEHVHELINNQDSYIWSIIEQLYFPQSTYSFAVFSSEILGNIYEIFLSEKVRITQDHTIEIQPKEDHIDRDVVTTPVFIVNEIIRNTITKFCEGKTADQILNSKFADIACGSGIFLIELFQVLQNILIDYYINNDRSQLEQVAQNNYRLKFAIKKKILTQCIYGVDKDLNAVKACSFGLLLKLLEDESELSVGTKQPILPSLDKNILFGNSLIDPDDVQDAKQLLQINPLEFLHEFDVIVGNPPYMTTENMKQLTPAELPIYKKKYISANKQFDKYYLFVERSLALLKKDGYLGYILPSKFMKVASGDKLRQFIANTKNLYKIISFGAQQVFKNKTTYTCLLFMKKDQLQSFNFYEVDDLNKWFVNRKDFNNFSTYEIKKLDSNAWSLNSEVDLILEKMRQKSLPLGDLLGKKAIANGIQTSANKVYIHKAIKQENGYIFFEYDDDLYQVEEELTRPYFETPHTPEDRFYTYKDVEPNAFVIYPYKKIGTQISLVEYKDLQTNYPKMFHFLKIIKPHLDNNNRSILPKPLTQNEWYRYGRSQALENCDVPKKIIVGILSNGYKYSIDKHQTFVASGGTAGYSIINIPDSCPYSIYYIQAILSSKYLEWFASIYGEIFRGGYIARGTKIQVQMPIPIIDFNNLKDKEKHDNIANLQKSMNDMYSQIITASTRNKIVLERNFQSNILRMDKLISQLFDLGDFDKKIPSIEEIYKSLS